mmetsp:Transcript_67283/g.194797  ORF Transcript_67283/g.194797 Transcript_67283/m.194797 type:complete len:273 (-) Transcript_67283:74-892(-)
MPRGASAHRDRRLPEEASAAHVRGPGLGLFLRGRRRRRHLGLWVRLRELLGRRWRRHGPFGLRRRGVHRGGGLRRPRRRLIADAVLGRGIRQALVLRRMVLRQRLLIPLHLEGRDQLASFAQNQATHGAEQGEKPTDDAHVDAAELQDIGGEEGQKHGHVQAHLRHDNGLLHVDVPEDIVPNGLVEGPRCVGPDVLRPHQRNERHGPRVHQLRLEVLELVDVGLEDPAIAIEHQGNDIHRDDHHRKDGAVEHHAEPHPPQHHRLLFWSRPLL